MSQKVVILCPGQGAQAIGMGLQWYEQSPIAKATFDEADSILNSEMDISLIKACFEGPAEYLNQTDICQPALYVAGIASYLAWKEQWESAGENPLNVAATAGLSLGEFTALHIAGVFSFADGLRLVAYRGKFMQEACENSPSTMVAITGADEEAAIKLVQNSVGPDGILVCANFNAPGQIVLSGDIDACQKAAELADAAGIRATPLTVAGAFHSPHMQSAADKMRDILENVKFHKPDCPVISNVTAKPHNADNPESIRQLLIEQITSPVRWSQSCQWLGDNITDNSVTYHELAPAKVLAGLMRKINREIKVVKHDKPEIEA